jgi:hypothetical protein
VTAVEAPAEPAEPQATDSAAPPPAEPAQADTVPAVPKIQDPRVAEAVALSAAALRHFLKDDHARARDVVERALALDPANRRALELQKILRVLG